MDTSRNDQLSELAAEATLAQADYLATASALVSKFLEANRDRIAGLGGVVLIDDEVDYLAVGPDLKFRCRSRYQDDATGKWVSETGVIESPTELIETYNLADVFAAFADATTADLGLEEEPVPAVDKAKAPDGSKVGSAGAGANMYAAVADDWAAAREGEEAPENEEEAAERLYDLALAFQERSQQTEAHLLEQFEAAACQLTAVLGDLIIVDDKDERLTLRASGAFAAEVVPETEAAAGTWRKLDSPDDIVEFYDPTDIFGDLADTLAEAFPDLGEPGGSGGHDGAREDREDREDAESGEDKEGDDHR